MNYFCPKCYGTKFYTVKLAQQGEDYVCTQNPQHVFVIDASGFPRTKQTASINQTVNLV